MKLKCLNIRVLRGFLDETQVMQYSIIMTFQKRNCDIIINVMLGVSGFSSTLYAAMKAMKAAETPNII